MEASLGHCWQGVRFTLFLFFLINIYILFWTCHLHGCWEKACSLCRQTYRPLSLKVFPLLCKDRLWIFSGGFPCCLPLAVQVFVCFGQQRDPEPCKNEFSAVLLKHSAESTGKKMAFTGLSWWLSTLAVSWLCDGYFPDLLLGNRMLS